MYLFIAILGIFLTIFFVVGIHEWGHFIVARLVGVKVARFSIGFGKAFYRWHDKKGTEYVLAPIPLGGYVKMVDETEEKVAPKDLPFAYNRQPFYKKFAIVLAGPLANVIFAFLIYWVIYMIGFTSIVPIIGKITPGSIAAEAGVQPNQAIISINNEPTSGWDNIIIKLIFYLGDKTQLPITTQNMSDKKTFHYTLNLMNWQVDDLRPDPLKSLGIEPYQPNIPPIIGKILPNTDAALKLKIGDTILAVNNKPITDWQDLIKQIGPNPDQSLSLKIKRDNKIMTVDIKTHFERNILFQKQGVIGIAPDFQIPANLLRNIQYNPIQAFIRAWQNTVDYSMLNFIVLGKLLTGKVSLASLGGPIMIFESAGVSLNNGILPFFGFLAFLSIAVAFINILPIPGLDGGHLLFQVIELIIRRPLPIRVQLLFYRLGVIVLLLLVTQAIINDIHRL